MAARRKVKTYEGYTALESYCIALFEFHSALKKAGFNDDDAFWILTDRGTYPDWILPNPTEWNPNNPDHQPFEDDED